MILINIILGGRFEDLVKAAIFEKTWSKLPSIVPDKEWLAKFRLNRAVGYKKAGGILSAEHDISFKLPGGGYMSTVYDAVSFAAHYRNESLLTSEQKMRAWKPHIPTRNNYYGLGFEV